MDLTWISIKGNQRQENRDFCGIAISKKEILFIVADGSTQGPKGKLLAEELCQYVVDEFLAINDQHDEHALSILKKAHTHLRIKYPADSASYLILISSKSHNKMKAYYLGDCRLGTFKNKIRWRTKVSFDGN